MSSITNIPYKEIEAELIAVAKEAGELMLKHAGTVDADNKKDAIDLVTFVDKQVETTVKTHLTAKFPDYKFIGEESSAGLPIPKEPCFIVDPVDGTSDFYHNFPFFCISLGFTVNQEPTIGVIYNPSLNQLFTAIKGQGAFLNGKPIPKVTKPLTLQKSLIAFEAGGQRTGHNFELRWSLYKKLVADKGGFIHGLF
ncbi:unnamed protein product [Ambrosiozyma monospora]|uniref:Unnamed protein product n=1 Tax=Ambrosiozyma monospora TaxID=43982 RepID=A0ACB5STZ1_AMBMO|nr:unnamed protein product [Ambrosiozyma monospora]